MDFASGTKIDSFIEEGTRLLLRTQNDNIVMVWTFQELTIWNNRNTQHRTFIKGDITMLGDFFTPLPQPYTLYRLSTTHNTIEAAEVWNYLTDDLTTEDSVGELVNELPNRIRKAEEAAFIT